MFNNVELKFKKINPNAIMPVKATSGSAGYDLSACLSNDIVIKPNEIKIIPLGIICEPSVNDIAMFIYPRSGLSSKHGVSLANCVGVIDSDYRGEWKVALINHSTEPYTITNGMRIAQLVIHKVIYPNISEVLEVSETSRGTGGFGSTGTD